ncbi:aryl hydrocarbon receptor nuclear translocator-like protein 1 isoform X1 [Culex quinquefasciatus]|uniref:aryl hydrocarbon receptor nuclear translocator-like protein 1 isoform X1 n=1 Tax=Culex quinquefasciatus TaxID=7176 RepID=UPI0018E3B453|nr:aryl hydrocarbon receptor nuclear translocator-like protein 1 isoform X1 [Culex quinquefasciatus]
MVARNFSLQDLPYNNLLQVPEEEREFLTLEELKPHQLTELGVSIVTSPGSNTLVTSIGSGGGTTMVASDITSHSSASGAVLSTGSLMQNYHHHQHQQQQHHQHLNGYYDIVTARSPANASTAGNEHLTATTASSVVSLDPMQGSSSVVGTAAVAHQPGDQHHYHQHHHQHHHHQLHSQHTDTDGGGSENDGGGGGSRKRKFSYNDNSDIEDDTGDDAKSVRTTDDNKKQNHSEIEKRRRDKMNTYITELSAMIPMCHAMSRKLDKLTVLRMAVQHLKTIRGAVHSYTEGHYKPAFLSDQELKMLILQAAEGFLFVVGCDRGRILYVSESVSQILNYSQGDLLGQSWFDILHPKDVAKVKEQLSSSDLSPRERLIDAKTMLPVKTDVPQGVTRLCPGARRSFFCRMKCKTNVQVKEEAESGNTSSSSCHRRKGKVNSDKKYSVIQCTGYLKSWAPAKIGLEEHETDGEGDSCNLSCLVAVGRVQPSLFQPPIAPSGTNLSNQRPTMEGAGAGTDRSGTNGCKGTSRNNIPNLRNVQFISRHAMDGKFLFVDQRATLVLGFLPQELLGTSMYEYYHHEDIPALAESHKAALQGNQCVTTPVYRLRIKESGFVRLQSEWKSFRNPWTKEIEYLIAKNNVILSELVESGGPSGRTMAGGATVHGSNGNGGGGGSSSNSTELSGGDGNNESNGQSTVGYDIFNNSANGREIQRMINSHVEAGKIGRQIAEQVLDHQRRTGESSAESSPDPAEPPGLPANFTPAIIQEASNLSSEAIAAVERTLALSSGVSPASSSGGGAPGTPQRVNGTLPGYNHVRNNSNAIMSPEHEVPHVQVNNSSAAAAAAADGNDEAAMAVIMSLLEADAGLGGPVDFSGLPWPLP